MNKTGQDVDTRDDLKDIRYLWRLDDPEWRRERKAQWKCLVENGLADYSATEKKLLKAYFVNAKKERYIGSITPYLLTPYDSPEMARKVFWSDLLDRRGRADILSRFLWLGGEQAEGLPWRRQHLQHFVEGVLGHEYRRVEHPERRGSTRNIAPDPSSWCGKFANNVVQVLDETLDYNGYIEAEPYFVSALAFATNAKKRKFMPITRLLTLVDQTLTNPNASAIAVEIAQKLKADEQTIRENWAANAHLDQET